MVVKRKNDIERLKELEVKISKLKFDLEETQNILEEEQSQREFYQMIADFTFDWELWFEPSGKIKYCSPSCFDLTGFSANQIITSEGISELLVYVPDREKFDRFFSGSLGQMVMNQFLEFRILTRHKQLRWCQMNVRGVYNKQGRYLGIRASIHNITRLKEAMGHIHELSEVKEMENRAKMRIKTRLDSKERELMTFLLQFSKKNEVINFISKQLNSIVNLNSNQIQKELKSLVEILGAEPASAVDWKMVAQEIENYYPGFLERLQKRHPNLTPKEERLCSYLKLGLSSKEIAGLQNINIKSVEVSRGRLRKKMKLKRQIRLIHYLDEI